MPEIEYPGGARFAFTILDDTDDATLDNVSPIYTLLHDLGMRTTKTVWALDTPEEQQGPYFAGQTLQDDAYRAWVKRLAIQGFEIAFHNASMGSATRERTISALDYLEREFGEPPALHCNHGQNRENLYWGPARYGLPPIRMLYSAYCAMRGERPMRGHDPSSEFYWGDVAHERLKYVRNFAFARLNCADIPPGRPYHDPRKPLVRRWFNTADAPSVHSFKRLVNRRSVDALSLAGGWSIVSTHLGKGFCRDGRIDPIVRETLEYLAELPGWFVPAGRLTDYLWGSCGPTELGTLDRIRLEVGHVVDRVRSRFTKR